jgi:hypothetical protein
VVDMFSRFYVFAISSYMFVYSTIPNTPNVFCIIHYAHLVLYGGLVEMF